MSVAKIKESQGYKTTPETCANCKHFQFREYHYASLFEGKKHHRVEVDGRGPMQIDPRNRQSFQNFFTDTFRCGFGGFAVKKLATCKQWVATPACQPNQRAQGDSTDSGFSKTDAR